ncbi:hypothetical protein QTP88_002788 [Uroleucon formosanum]
MVYISQSGNLHETVPMKKKIIDTFWGVINFVSFFVQSLVRPNSTRWGNQYTVTYRRPGSSSSGTVRPQRRFGGFGPSTSAPAPPSTCSSCMG